MSYNLYRRLRDLIPDDPLVVGTVVSVSAAGALVQLPDGSQITARGEADIADRVFVRAGVIEGAAPALAVVTIDV